MIHPIFKFETECCTPKLLKALDDTLSVVIQSCPVRILMEHLLLSISSQEEFIAFCNDANVDLAAYEGKMKDFADLLSTSHSNRELAFILSPQLEQLAEVMRKKYEEAQRLPDPKSFHIGISDVVVAAYDIYGSIFNQQLRLHLGENIPDVKRRLDNFYNGDIQSYHELREGSHDDDSDNSREHKPQFMARAFINGKPIDLGNVTPDELYDKMMASASRLMGALSALGNGVKPEKAKTDSKENGKRSQSQQSDQSQQPGQPQMRLQIQNPFETQDSWESYVTNISKSFTDKNPLIGREEELDRCIRIMYRREKNNPIFIGEPGVGKTALIYGLAKKIFCLPFKDECLTPAEEWLSRQSIYSLDMATLIAGSSLHGEFERRIKLVLEGLSEKGNCIVYIDEIHTVCETGGGNVAMPAAELLKPYLDDGRIRFIGSTTYKDYNRSVAKNKAFARRFSLVDVKEPGISDTIHIISELLSVYENHHNVRYDSEAVTYAVEQSAAMIHDRFLPDKAIEIIDEAGAYLQQHPLLRKDGTPKAKRYQVVSKDIVRHVMTEVCHIDAKALASTDNSLLKDFDKRIGADIYGQDEAVMRVARAVMMSKAGLSDPEKPMASLLFVGPTGVGKTELCKVLARELGVELLRFDMSEYTEKHTISKLIGTPAGYVGYDDGGLLTDAVRKTPNCVLLLDEIEKAHADIYNILLQVMDYGRLTDSKGFKVDFRNVIIILTSNAGAQYAGRAAIGFGLSKGKGQAMLDTVKKTFKPEFLNRLSGTVVFNDMDRQMATLVLEKKLRQLSVRISDKKVEMNVSDDAKDFLLDHGFSVQYGAREMDRAIQQHLSPLLMDEILFGKLRKGGIASITVKGDSLSVACTQNRQ